MAEEEAVEQKSWADKIAEELKKKKLNEYVCEGMWTPSGYFHIGNARSEIFTPYAVCKALGDMGLKARQNFVIDDFDAVRKMPQGLGVKEGEQEKYLGYPMALAPSPIKGYKSWADVFTSQIKEVIGEFGINLNFISSYDCYKKGKLNSLIIQSLDNSKKIVEIWNRVAGAEKNPDFLPIQVLCEKCGKIYYTQANSWDGKKVSYTCQCGHSSSISPLNGNAKLHWRVHWVAMWVLNNVSFESGGKDHFSKGGSVDVAQAFCREVFSQAPPLQIPTEFIQIGGEKMSGSVGNVVDLKEWLGIAPAEAFRYLNFSYRPNSVIEFNLRDNSFVLLMERFERAERIHYGLEKDATEKLNEKIKRDYQLSCIKKPAPKAPPQVSYAFASYLAQLMDPKKELDKIIQVMVESMHIEKKKFSPEEKKFIQKKLIQAKTWADKYAPEQFRIKFLESIPADIKSQLSEKVKNSFPEIASSLQGTKTADEIQQMVFSIAQKNSLAPRDLFQALYLIFLGKRQGPKIGSLILALGKEKSIKRLKEAA